MGKNALRRCCHLTRFSCFIILLVVVGCGWLAGCCRQQQSLWTCTLKRQHEKLYFVVCFQNYQLESDDVQSRSLQGNTVVVNWTASYIKTAKHVLMIFLVKLLSFKFFVSSIFFYFLLIDMCYWMVFGYQGDLVSWGFYEKALRAFRWYRIYEPWLRLWNDTFFGWMGSKAWWRHLIYCLWYLKVIEVILIGFLKWFEVVSWAISGGGWLVIEEQVGWFYLLFLALSAFSGSVLFGSEFWCETRLKPIKSTPSKLR